MNNGGMGGLLEGLVGSYETQCTLRVHHRGRLARCCWLLPAGRFVLGMRFCHFKLHNATPFGELWLRRARVRVPSVTLLHPA